MKLYLISIIFLMVIISDKLFYENGINIKGKILSRSCHEKWLPLMRDGGIS